MFNELDHDFQKYIEHENVVQIGPRRQNFFSSPQTNMGNVCGFC